MKNLITVLALLVTILSFTSCDTAEDRVDKRHISVVKSLNNPEALVTHSEKETGLYKIKVLRIETPTELVFLDSVVLDKFKDRVIDFRHTVDNRRATKHVTTMVNN